jgi:hypothetical protein
MLRTALATAFVSLLVMGGRGAAAPAVDEAKHEVVVKIVYYGPGPLVQNLRYIYRKTDRTNRGDVITLGDKAIGDEQRYWYLAVTLGPIRGYQVHLDLYTVAPDPRLPDSRKQILVGANAVVFVGDAGKGVKVNVDWFAELTAQLKADGIAIDTLPIVFQIDGGNAQAVEAVKRALVVGERPVFIGDPAAGTGVFESLKEVTKAALLHLRAQP